MYITIYIWEVFIMDKKNLPMIGLIAGCVGILFTILGMIPALFIFSFLAPICAIVALLCGIITLKNPDGSANNMALAALIIGIVFFVIDIPVFICGVCSCRAACFVNDVNNFLNSLI